MPLGSSRKGSVKATPAQVTAGLVAYVEIGTATGAARQVGAASQTVDEWIKANPDELRRIRDSHRAHTQAIQTAVSRAAAEGLKEGVIVCREILAGGPDGKTTASIVRALSGLGRDLDHMARLDRGEPTERISVDDRSDDQLVSDIQRHLNSDEIQRAMKMHAKACSSS